MNYRDLKDAVVHFLNRDHETGLSFMDTTTMRDFLIDHCESDPSQSWYIKHLEDVLISEEDQDDDGNITAEAVYGEKWEVRQNPYSQTWPDKLFGTFDTYEEAEEFLLDGLLWNLNNGKCEPPPHSFSDQDELLDELKECRIHHVTSKRLALIHRLMAMRRFKREKERSERLSALVGDHAAVIQEWYRSEAYHPAPKEVMDIKEKFSLTWKEIRAIGKGRLLFPDPNHVVLGIQRIP